MTTTKTTAQAERPETGPAPDLAGFDLILVNTSAGKDSQVLMDEVVAQAEAAGVRDRVVAVHADLGRVEWEGTRDLAAEHAAHYGLPFEVVRNGSWTDLLERIESHGRWPGRATRYCTSEFKGGQVATLMTALVRLAGIQGRKVRILNAMGMRAQESYKRAQMVALEYDVKRSNKTLRDVWAWLPIHQLTEDQVWARIAQAGTRAHEVYAQGMPRLSCSFCPLASMSHAVRAAQLRPALAAEYAAVEVRIGHRFSDKFSMAEVIDAAAAADQLVDVEDWAA